MARFAIWTAFPLVVFAALALWFMRDSETEPTFSGPVTIVAFGDSLTEGLGVPMEDNYPSQLERALREKGIEARLVNEGVSGDTTAGALARVARALSHRADIVVVALGANDALRSVPPAEVRENLRAIIREFRSSGSRVVLAGFRAPFTAGGKYAGEFNAIYPELAEEFGIAFIPYFLDGVVLREKLNIEDRIHPNKDGYTMIVAEYVLPAVLEELSALAKESATR